MTSPLAVPSVEELARQLVEALVPEEVPTFAVVAAPYLGDSRRAERRLRQAHDDPLGFGLGDVAAMATPVIVLVSGSVVTALAEGVADSVRSTAAGFLRRMVHRVRRRGGRLAPGSPTMEWTMDHLTAVRQVALTRAQDLGMEQSKAEALADAVVGALLRRQDEQR